MLKFEKKSVAKRLKSPTQVPEIYLCFPKCLVVARVTFLITYIALLQIPQSLQFKFDFKNINILLIIIFNDFYFNNEQSEDYGTSKYSLFPGRQLLQWKIRGNKQKTFLFYIQSATPNMTVV